MPANRAAGQAGVVAGKLYVVGGVLPSAKLEMYDPGSDTWTNQAPMQTARWGMGVDVINGALYVVGGSADPGEVHTLSTLEVFTPVRTVAIDIKPGSSPNTINLGSRGTVPVAILSTASFDATTVDPGTATLAGAGVKMRRDGAPLAAREDVNADGLLDLVVHVEMSALQLSESDTQAVLEGRTFSGTRIRGSDSVRIVP